MKSTDAEFHQKLLGSWIAPSGAKWHFGHDGSWSHDSPRRHCSYSGTWQIWDKELATTITNYAGPPKSRAPMGQVLRCTVVQVTYKELVEDLGEATVTLQR